MGASVDVEVSKLHEELFSCFYRNNKRYLFYTIASRMFTSCIGLWYAYIFMEIINAAQVGMHPCSGSKPCRSSVLW